jgi:hypothetical protein
VVVMDANFPDYCYEDRNALENYDLTEVMQN